MMRSGIKQENVSFEVRLPKEGMYKISIYSGRDDEWGDDPPLTSSFRIVCDQLDSQCVPDMAPIDPGIVGWGPGPKALKSGLLIRLFCIRVFAGANADGIFIFIRNTCSYS
jgi:hypothetical protein